MKLSVNRCSLTTPFALGIAFAFLTMCKAESSPPSADGAAGAVERGDGRAAGGDSGSAPVVGSAGEDGGDGGAGASAGPALGGSSGGAVAVAVGDDATCVLAADGSVSCFGKNDVAELGTREPRSSSVLLKVPGISGATALGVSILRDEIQDTFCAVVDDGAVTCWGYIGGDMLTLVSRDMVRPATCKVSACLPTAMHHFYFDDGSPVEDDLLASGVKMVTPIKPGVCALRDEGFACWRPAGQYVLHSSGLKSFAMAYGVTCALTATGGVGCWAEDFADQGLGVSGAERGSSQVPVGTLLPGLESGAKAVAAGQAFACAITSEDAVACWGAAAKGQLGTLDDPAIHTCLNTSPENLGMCSPTPLQIAGLPKRVVSLAASESSACVVTDAGAVMCWGYSSGELLGDVEFSPTPVVVPGLESGFKSVWMGRYSACAISVSGGIRCWGGGSDREIDTTEHG